LKTQNVFYQDLTDLNAEMRGLVSDLIEIKDMIRIDLLRVTVIETMKTIVEASDDIRTFLAKRGIGELIGYLDGLVLIGMLHRKKSCGAVSFEASRVQDDVRGLEGKVAGCKIDAACSSSRGSRR
jgi:hypothetical protein